MIPLIPYIITILLMILGLISKKSRVLFFTQLIWLWVLLGWTSGGMDFNNYEQMYNLSANYTFTLEPNSLYFLGCKIFNDLSLTLIHFNIFISFISLLLISSTILKYSKNPAFVLSLFYLFPFIESIIQKRYFLAMSIIIFGIRYLVDNKNIFKYIVCCLIATLIHSSAIIFLILPFLKQINFLKIRKFIIPIIVLAFLAFKIYPFIADVIVDNQKIFLYFEDMTQRMSTTKAIIFCFIHIIFVIIFNLFYKKDDNHKLDKYHRFSNFVCNVNLISLIFMPLYFYNSAFFRIFRNLMILSFIMISNKQVSQDIQNVSIFRNTLISISSLIAAFLIFYCFTGSFGFDILVKPLFTENELIKFLFGG